MSQSNVIKGYDLQKVEELTGLSRSQVRTLVKKEILKPTLVGKKHYFSLLDLKLFKEIKTFFDQNVSKKHKYRDLQVLRQSVEASQPLTSMSFKEIENRLYVRDSSFLYSPALGEYQLDFHPPHSAVKANSANQAEGRVLNFRRNDSEETSLEEDETTWYKLALVKESEGKMDDAILSYKKELETNPLNHDASINLGRLYQTVEGDYALARACYESVLLHEPEDEIANYNLGTIWEILDDTTRAMACYDKAISLPDAYFNKGRLFDRLGSAKEAELQYHIYDQMLIEFGDDWDEDPES